MVFRTRVIVRLRGQIRMVTKGYRKGVYDRVTCETRNLPIRVGIALGFAGFRGIKPEQLQLMQKLIKHTTPAWEAYA
jgi:hypothetical protein